jgi:LmbE family N-acetylglucosaminyl deacetylase
VARTYNLVFAVCHPDDEALWIGGLLCELARLPFIRAYVVCLSGKDEQSPRMKEFEAAREVAGYARGTILGFPLRPALDPLPDTSRTLQEGLAQLGLLNRDVDLVITHSSYGDEHKHPHHSQAYSEIGQWCAAADVPFGFFSCLPLTWLRHTPFAIDLRRRGTLHLLNASRCESVFSKEHYDADPNLELKFQLPKYYLQFLIDAAAKTRMLHCYPSIGLEPHERGYAMFNNYCEAIYLGSERAFEPWRAIIEAMDVPAEIPLLKSIDLRDYPVRTNPSDVAPRIGLLSRVRRKLGRLTVGRA